MRLPNPPFLKLKQSAEYANRKSGEVESLVILWVRFPPRSVSTRSRGPTAKTPARHAGDDGSTPSGITRWSVGVLAPHVRGKDEDRVQLPDGPATETTDQ